MLESTPTPQAIAVVGLCLSDLARVLQEGGRQASTLRHPHVWSLHAFLTGRPVNHHQRLREVSTAPQPASSFRGEGWEAQRGRDSGEVTSESA